MRKLLPLLFLLIAGCLALDPLTQQPEAEPPDYSYNLLVKETYSVPDYPRLTDDYTTRVLIQIYGPYTPSGYSLQILDGNTTLMEEKISNPGLLDHYDFPFYANDTTAHHLRVEVRSLDSNHPEPEENLEDNVLRKDIKAYPLGFYDVYNWRYTWFYDAVGVQVKQAQAFTLEKKLNISKIGVYVQARVPPAPGSKLIISLHEKPTNWGNIGLGNQLRSGEIDATGITQKPSWKYVEFPSIELSNDSYWIVLGYESPSSAGIEWYRVEGNEFGEVYDTQMLDIAGYGEWEYKSFDFAFKIG